MSRKFSIYLDNINNIMVKEASKQKSALKKILAGKFVYLKMDASTKKTQEERESAMVAVSITTQIQRYGGRHEKIHGAERSKLV